MTGKETKNVTASVLAKLRNTSKTSGEPFELQAMVALGNANSRMRDFFDVWICSNHLDFNADALLKTIDATFENRDTPAPADEVEALTTAFVETHRVQWRGDGWRCEG
ncbi:MAG: nucleotidyl transferase AbiEii/AbiGii toxin family protein [Peristeroidobacter soli]